MDGGALRWSLSPPCAAGVLLAPRVLRFIACVVSKQLDMFRSSFATAVNVKPRVSLAPVPELLIYSMQARSGSAAPTRRVTRCAAVYTLKRTEPLQACVRDRSVRNQDRAACAAVRIVL